MTHARWGYELGRQNTLFSRNEGDATSNRRVALWKIDSKFLIVETRNMGRDTKNDRNEKVKAIRNLRDKLEEVITQ